MTHGRLTTPVAAASNEPRNDRYKWVALSNTTLGILMVTINQSILLISLPDIFRGIALQPLAPGNTSYFLWVFMGFLLVTAVLVVSLGRVGDMYGRVRMYNLGFAIFTVFSILLSVTFMTGSGGALWIILMRVGQGVGGAFLFANSSAILTDAFPSNERGKAMGINGVALVTGSFVGLVLGGVLAPIEWRLVFLVSVPFGLFGTVWAYLKLEDTGVRQRSTIDWWGNATFAVGLISVLVGIVYGLLPYGGHTMGWTSPFVLSTVLGGLAVLAVFVVFERKVANPMFHLELFGVRPYAAGVLASFLSAVGRGGVQFMLIIWLQGIWLPEHGYSFARTPLWAGIAMVPLTVGFLVSGPLSGILADHYGARWIATIGLSGSALAFVLLELLPMNFDYVDFAAIVFVFSVFAGMFFTPNQTAVMNSLPPSQRGAGAGMNGTFMNSASVLSIGLFFTIVTLGLASSLPGQLEHGLLAEGVPAIEAVKFSHLPPIGALFAAFLGYSPIKTELPHQVLASLGAARASYLTGRSFFPRLIASSFQDGLRLAFDFGAGLALMAAIASWVRGGKYIHAEEPLLEEVEIGLLEVGEVAAAEIGAGYLGTPDLDDLTRP
ncbi:MAG: MFS transporter [Actinomycetota bacterium]|jgi:MFS family permease|nr:MFS transporter [Actinomycetota bacterium]